MVSHHSSVCLFVVLTWIGPCCGYCGSGPFEPLQLNEHIKAMHKGRWSIQMILCVVTYMMLKLTSCADAELLLVKRRRIGLSGISAVVCMNNWFACSQPLFSRRRRF
jgi:hypothetical protein